MRTTVPKNAVLIPKNAKRVFKGLYYDTYHWDQKLFDGSIATYEMLKRADTVKVIAVVDDKIIMLDQEQPHLGHFYDIPGGIHDHEEEDELQAAKRELLEETGMKFRNWKLLNSYQFHNKIEQFVYIFLAKELISEQDQNLDAGERITVKLLSFEEVKKMLGSDKGRYLPKEIEKTNSLEELLKLPEYK